MYKCNYCNRHLKKKYDKCPACGSNSFEKINNIGQYVINTPPKDGYKINLKNYKIQKMPGKFLLIGTLIIVLNLIAMVSFFTIGGYETNEEIIFSLVFLAIFIILALICTFRIFREANNIMGPVNKNIKKAKELSKNGILIKNLTYKIKPVDKRIKGPRTIYKIQVIYEVEKGVTKNFESEPKYLNALGRDDGTVDLLLDPNDYSNYYIDFDIY
jgi:hypothetical protein